MINARLKFRIQEKLEKIKTGNFVNDDIELFLIYIRDFIDGTKFPLLKELCHFIAHPNRDRGVICDEMDIFYSKMKYLPKHSGCELDFTNVHKRVFELLFEKGVMQMDENYIIEKTGKTKEGLVKHIYSTLFKKNGATYTIVNLTAEVEAKSILTILAAVPPVNSILREEGIINEIMRATNQVCTEISYSFDVKIIEKYAIDFLLIFLSIIQDCHFSLHDGSTAKGYVIASSMNALYKENSKTDNLNLAFAAHVPVEKSYAIFILLNTSILVGKRIPDPEGSISWFNSSRESGRLNLFNLSRGKVTSL